MKILITGSFCSGKSTLSSQLNLQLTDSILIEDVARDLLTVYKNLEWSLPELRDYLIISQLVLERKSSLQNKSFVIVDSGIISNIAHDIIFNIKYKNRKKIIDRLGHTRYDLVFNCDHSEINLVDDGKRTNRDLQEKLSYAIKEALEYLNYKDYIYLKGSKKERLKKVLEYALKGDYYGK
jgi:nicotinamide riboside kinase